MKATELTRFQIDILQFLHQQARHGAGLRRELEEYYDEEINHRRIYENLNKLDSLGLVEKNEFEVSDKSHRYDLTQEGQIIVYEYFTEGAVRLNII